MSNLEKIILDSQKHLKNKEFQKALTNIDKVEVVLQSFFANNYQLSDYLISTMYKTLCIKGNIYLNLKAYNTSVSSFENAISVNPNYSLAYSGLGKVQYMRKNYLAAKRNFEKALNLNPNDNLAIKGLETVNIKLGLESDNNSRNKEFENSIPYEQLSNLFGLSKSNFKNGNHFEAIIALDLCEDLLFEGILNNTAILMLSQIYLLKGFNYEKLGLDKEADKNYSLAKDMFPYSNQIEVEINNILENNKNILLKTA